MHPDTQQTSLIIFAKEPKIGKVKTRLAKDLSQELALDLYKAFVKDVLAMAKQIPCSRRVIYYTGGSLKGSFLSTFGNDFEYVRQTGKDLGTRMSTAFKRSFQEKSKKTVIIGTDCLTIKPGDILAAFEKLSKFDCVLGPSRDGGYYLIGLNRPNEGLFKGVKWSTDKVFSQTIANARKGSCRVALLEKKEDIDTFRSLRRYQNKVTRNDYTSIVLERQLHKCVK